MPLLRTAIAYKQYQQQDYKVFVFYQLQATSLSDPTLAWTNVYVFKMYCIYQNKFNLANIYI